MPVTTQTIHNGERYAIVKAHIDGEAADLAGILIIDASALNANEVSILSIDAGLTGFSAVLAWDATVNVDALNLPDGEDSYDFTRYGGLPNNAGAGKTGNILVSTTGLGAGDEGTIIFRLKKK